MTKMVQRKSSKKEFNGNCMSKLLPFSVPLLRNCERVVKKKGTGLDDERAVAIMVGKFPSYLRHKRSKCEHADM